jgi:hypothetical protein
MRKIILIIAVIIIIIMGCIACESASLKCVLEPQQYQDVFSIYYVKNSRIKDKAVIMPADMGDIINEWLRANQLEEQYELLYSYINDGLSNYSLQQFEYVFVYNDSYVFCFSGDINSFLQKEENILYYETFISTLQNADKVISNIYNQIINKN